MDATADLQVEEEAFEEDFSVEIPSRGTFVPCDQCGLRSYGYYVLTTGDRAGSLLAFCAHHDHQNHDKLTEKYAAIHVDYSDDLIENRLKED